MRRCIDGRCSLICICVLQLVLTFEHQVFCFLGKLWVPIIVNFIQIVFLIFGIFGTVQFRPKVVLLYILWCVLFIGWNVFLVCLYLDVSSLLSKQSEILSFNTGLKSWWLSNGLGCRKNETSPESAWSLSVSNKVPDEYLYTGCWIPYYYVETIHSSLQCLLSVYFVFMLLQSRLRIGFLRQFDVRDNERSFGTVVAIYVVYVFSEEDDSSHHKSSLYDTTDSRRSRRSAKHSRSHADTASLSGRRNGSTTFNHVSGGAALVTNDFLTAGFDASASGGIAAPSSVPPSGRKRASSESGSLRKQRNRSRENGTAGVGSGGSLRSNRSNRSTRSSASRARDRPQRITAADYRRQHKQAAADRIRSGGGTADRSADTPDSTAASQQTNVSSSNRRTSHGSVGRRKAASNRAAAAAASSQQSQQNLSTFSNAAYTGTLESIQSGHTLPWVQVTPSNSSQVESQHQETLNSRYSVEPLLDNERQPYGSTAQSSYPKPQSVSGPNVNHGHHNRGYVSSESDDLPGYSTFAKPVPPSSQIISHPHQYNQHQNQQSTSNERTSQYPTTSTFLSANRI